MNFGGVALATLSGVCNGLFTAPLKLRSGWRWENTWFVFIVVACLAMPVAIVAATVPGCFHLLSLAPRVPLAAALAFGFAWGFGAISFGQSVHFLGVSIANSLVIGLSSALGSLVPLFLGPPVVFGPRLYVLVAGIIAFIAGVALCGAAGWQRDQTTARATAASFSVRGYLFAIAAGIMSAVFNIGFTLALPITRTGEHLGISTVSATNVIWLLMLGAGSIPNLVYCALLMQRNGTASLLVPSPRREWLLAILMGLLWGGSIFLYGAAVPRLGNMGPSIGWPLSLAVGLAVANFMGLLLSEWSAAPIPAVRRMRFGLATLLVAIVLCGLSARLTV